MHPYAFPCNSAFRRSISLHDAWLCDGCTDERDEHLSPWSHGFSMYLEPH